jgi:serine/threonine protein phosphatase 1
MGAQNLLTYAIGDVHGCREKLWRLLAFCERHRREMPARYVFLGDYVDRGPDSYGTVSTLIQLQRDRPKEVICLCGNHELMMLAAVGPDENNHRLWAAQGGIETLESYGVETAGEVPAEHRDWINSLPLWFDDGLRFFVHAGVNPAVALGEQVPDVVLWIREPFLSSSQDHGRLVVHGHTRLRSVEPDLRSNRLNLDTGAVYGGPLSAAVFDDDQVEPIAFLNDLGEERAAAGFRL